jgi:5-methylcytosine-specific restriction endonuclease McrA
MPELMTNLQSLSSMELLTNTKSLVAREREVTSQVLWHLREIEARRLFAELGFSSLFDYVVKDLGYSASSAMRRIQAMRLLRELPEIEEQLKSGILNLSHLSSVQSFFQNERKHEGKTYSKEEKFDLLKSFEGTSQREAERALVALSPESMIRMQEKVRPLNETHVEFKTVISAELLQKLERVKELAAHRTKSSQWSEILEVMADLTIKALDPKTKAPKDAAKLRHSAAPTPAIAPSKSRYIPKALKTSTFARAEGQCEYKDEITGRRCSCRSFLQVDHIVPLALGGTTSADNLRILCQAHNQWAAMRNFGRSKMEKHWLRS